MATPTMNAVGVTSIDTALLGAGKYVAHGEKWGGALGTGVTLTFSFPNFNSYWASPYGVGDEPFTGFRTTTAAEQSAIRAALSTWSRFANVTFVETTEAHVSGGNVGELRFGFSSAVGGGSAAHAYYPSSDPEAGDVWFSRVNFNHNGGGVPPGSFDFLAILHELGHALGLKHSFDLPNAAPAAQDNYFYSIMSYTASRFSAHGDNFASFYPTTPMYYDLLAIEKMYGQRAYHPGNDVYTFNDGARYWQAINDTGGRDRIVYHGAESSTINLNPGAFSSLSEAIQFHRPNGSIATSRATVTIGPNVVIEDATGGNGNDTLIGNAANNILNGTNGNDTINGSGGYDYLMGGNGNDRLWGHVGSDKLLGGAGSDQFYFNTALNASTNRDTVMDYNPTQDSLHLENAIFTRLPVSAHLSSAYFRAASHALDRNDYIVYDRGTGGLFYDPNGNGAGDGVMFALFSNKPVLTASEFAVF